MTSDRVYGPAAAADAGAIAELVAISSDGVAVIEWQQEADTLAGRSALDVGRAYTGTYGDYSDRNCTMAEQDGRIAFEQNEGSVRLYRRPGYRVARRAPVVPHPLIHYTGDALLMVADV